MTSLRSTFDAVVRNTARALKADGFARVGQQLRRELPRTRQFFIFTSRSSSTDALNVAVDYAIHLKSLDRFFRDEQRPDSYWSGAMDFGGRLGFHLRGQDYWWQIDTQTDPAEVAAEVVVRARAEAFAFFEERGTDERTFDLLWPMWASGRLSMQSQVTLAMLSKGLGKAQECETLCENLMTKYSSEYFVRSRVAELKAWKLDT